MVLESKFRVCMRATTLPLPCGYCFFKMYELTAPAILDVFLVDYY